MKILHVSLWEKKFTGIVDFYFPAGYKLSRSNVLEGNHSWNLKQCFLRHEAATQSVRRRKTEAYCAGEVAPMIP
jgi:hypothetical protein